MGFLLILAACFVVGGGIGWWIGDRIDIRHARQHATDRLNACR